MKDLFSDSKKLAWGLLAILGICAMLVFFVVGGKNESKIETLSASNQAAQVTRIEENRVAGEEALYHNQIEACIRGNSIRVTQLEEAQKNGNARAEHRILTVDHARPSGAIECKVAIKLPPSLSNGGIRVLMPH